MRLFGLTLVLMLATLTSCDKGTPSNDSKRAQRALPSSTIAALTRHIEPKRRRRGRRGGMVPVYVDEQFVGALRFQELPPELEVSWAPLDEGYFARRFSFVNYFKALGIPAAKMRQLHIYGGRSRVLVIGGQALRQAGDGIQFQFRHGMGGKPEYRHTVPVDANTSIDRIGAVALYVDKKTPTLKHGRLYRDGQRVSLLHHAQSSRRRGTRIYLDGKLLQTLSRQNARAAMIPDGETYALSSLFKWLDVDAHELHGAQFISRDKVTLELDATALRQSFFDFTLPQRSRGRMRLLQHDQHINALLLYSRPPSANRSQKAPRAPKSARSRQSKAPLAIRSRRSS